MDNVENAKNLISAFHIDCLCGASLEPDAEVEKFIKLFPHLAWPIFEQGIFTNGEPNFLDISHPVRKIYEEYLDRQEPEAITSYFSLAKLYKWNENDPLRFMLLATLGGYPQKGLIKRDYRGFVQESLRATRIFLSEEHPIPPQALDNFSPQSISKFNLLWDRPPAQWPYGLYLGQVDDFYDMVNYWNLRAADLELVFYDSRYSDRLNVLRNTQIDWIRNHFKGIKADEQLDDAIPVWSSDAKHLESLRAEGLKLYLNSVEPDMWQGYSLQPPLMHFGDKSILAAISTESDLPNYSFQLPDKPFVDEDDFHTQHLAVSVRPPLFRPKKLGTTFFAPFLPELNDFYRRNATFPGTGVRVEVRGLGIVTEADVSTLTVTGFRTQELISRVFSVFGFKAEISHAGRFATRLIEQMGGIQGCRVFKIRGVRRLIEQYSPLKSFTKSAAIQLIRDINPVTKVSNFGKYESLFIKYRETPKLTPELVFNYLAEKDVFRVGLALKCPSCELDFWVPLDDAKTEIQCEYCGNRFNIMPYLHDRDWAYRRSGLFGRDDHQQGSIPVALTIQQLETILHGSLRSTIFVGGQQIKMMGPPSKECEVDFVALVQDVHGRIQIAFGECKTGHYGITAQDVGNLSVLADAFPRERVQPFIVFSKTSPFTEAEIELCRKAQGKAWEQRVILLSDRELEPYYAYEDAANEFEVKPSASSLDMMAMATQTIYFHPKRRS